MDKVLTVNDILKNTVTKLDTNLLPPCVHQIAGHGPSVRSIVYQTLSAILDGLGEKSARAQQLNRVITTADKMRNSNHTLYLLKDPSGDKGKGEVIGYLKIGTKKLYLHDELERVSERDTLCVLDFFVVESHRRQGYGKFLFEYMLEDQDVKVQQLAIDGPSPKMEMFLRKNYNVQKLMRQRNNFAVAPGFFQESYQSRSGCSTPQLYAPPGRYAAPRPACAIASIIHGDGSSRNDNDNIKKELEDLHLGQDRFDTPSPGENWSDPPSPQENWSDPPSAKENWSNPPSPKNGSVQPMPKADIPRPSTLPVNTASENIQSDPATLAPAGTQNQTPNPPQSQSRAQSPGYTAQGHVDLKFFHNKLW